MDAKMEDLKKSMEGDKEKDIVFSKSIKAGKRIYYVDVKRNRKDELFIAVTESKKVVSGDADSPAVTYEKHKIFLYQEDFDQFLEGLKEAVRFIRSTQPGMGQSTQATTAQPEEGKGSQDFDFDIDLHVDELNLPKD